VGSVFFDYFNYKDVGLRRFLIMLVLNTQNNKYTPHLLPEIVAPRSELLDRLEQAAEKKLILISAPGGTGKTVTTLLWIKKTQRKAVWIGLDTYDNSVAIFYKMFCTGILSVQPDNDRMTAILQAPAFLSSPVEYTIMLLAEFMLDESEYFLVLDDFHTITNQEILKSLPYILRRLPYSFVTLILSRNRPRVFLSEYMINEQAKIIKADDLSFKTEEIIEYFGAHGRGITAEEAESAFTYTGGWAIAVTALAHSSEQIPQGFGGRLLDTYIKKHLWNEWDKATQTFLLTSAVIDEMPVELCKKITGRADAGALLEHLREQNAFVICVEDGVYRYHHLFLEFLRAQPEYIKADKDNSFILASKYYLHEKGGPPITHYYAYKSGNIEAILYSLNKYHTTVAYTRNIGEINYFRNMLFSPKGESLCKKYPILYASNAYAAFLMGDADKYEKYVDKLKQNLSDVIHKHPQFVEYIFVVVSIDYRISFSNRTALPKSLLQNIVEDNKEKLTIASFSLQMPFLHRSFHDHCELIDKNIFCAFNAKYIKLFRENNEYITHSLRAGLFLEQNQTHDALIEAQDAVGKLAEWTMKEIRFAVQMHLAAVYSVLDKKTELSALLEEVGKFINEDALFLRLNYLAFTTRIKLWNGDNSAAREWLDYYFVTESVMLETYRIYQYFTTARAYAVLGELEKAKKLAARLRQMGKNFRRPQDAAEAGVLLAAVLWAEGNKKEAQEMMETVLLEMQPYSFVRLIADEGAAILQVLKKILHKTKHADYQGLHDPVYVNSVYIAAYAVSKQRKGIMAQKIKKAAKLSKQQKMIIELLAQGDRRESIAEKAGISLNTVKAHLKAAYGKLGSANAADAVLKARELGLI